MIILDTNILSALMRVAPGPRVIRWLDRQPVQSIWTTSITVFEAHMGLKLLPAGRRRRALEAAFQRVLEEDLENRVLDFDLPSALAAATLAAERQRRGHTVDFRDTQIAGIALARDATIATRNVRHFSDLNVSIVDPWQRSP
jgi:predicted nucleic acid-binding protein